MVAPFSDSYKYTLRNGPEKTRSAREEKITILKSFFQDRLSEELIDLPGGTCFDSLVIDTLDELKKKVETLGNKE